MNNAAMISQTALLLTLKIIAMPIICATVIGLIVGLFQTVMQIQEQTLSFGLKMLVVFFCIFLLGEKFSIEMINFCTLSFHLAFK